MDLMPSASPAAQRARGRSCITETRILNDTGPTAKPWMRSRSFLGGGLMLFAMSPVTHGTIGRILHETYVLGAYCICSRFRSVPWRAPTELPRSPHGRRRGLSVHQVVGHQISRTSCISKYSFFHECVRVMRPVQAAIHRSMYKWRGDESFLQVTILVLSAIEVVVAVPTPTPILSNTTPRHCCGYGYQVLRTSFEPSRRRPYRPRYHVLDVQDEVVDYLKPSESSSGLRWPRNSPRSHPRPTL